MAVTGRIHSVETCGTVDGPGIRFVVFTQGCPLRCLYCHNPDCRTLDSGKEIQADELIQEIQKYTSYMKFSGGGVTISGGEPFVQPAFIKEVFQRCHDLQIHTALDTSGYVGLDTAKEVLPYVDLVLLDIKSYDPELYRTVTSVSVAPTLQLAEYLSEINKPTWIRYVLVPGLTDDLEKVEELAQFLVKFKNIEWIEVLPFHKMGEYKWEQLGYDYKLKDTPPASPELVDNVCNIFRKYLLPVR